MNQALNFLWSFECDETDVVSIQFEQLLVDIFMENNHRMEIQSADA